MARNVTPDLSLRLNQGAFPERYEAANTIHPANLRLVSFRL
jgi:hypothetical protein